MRIFSLILLFTIAAFAQSIKVPHLEQWANDYSNTLSQDELSALNNKLRAYEDSTSNQVVLCMIPTLDDYPIEDYAYEVASQNKVGSKKNNNGIVLLVSKNDKKLRIEVGYGLEGAIPDALSNSIIRNVIVPYFKQNQYYAGIDAGLDAIFAAARGEYTAERKNTGRDKSLPPIFSIIAIILFIFFSIIRRGRRGLGGSIFYGGRGGGFGGFGGGGFGGGGFGGGGFSGGGGSFGGGGSSGSW